MAIAKGYLTFDDNQLIAKRYLEEASALNIAYEIGK